MSEDGAGLSEFELAMMDAFRVLADILIQAGIPAERLETILGGRIRHWEQKGKPRTVEILKLLLEMSTDPAILEHRRQLNALRKTDPKGSA